MGGGSEDGPALPGCAMTGEDLARLHADALRALSSVTDPELDEPITDLGFVKDVSIEDGIVTVDITTSTFWCSPNFVYMMLEDAREAVSRVSGVRTVKVHLEGHHDAGKINAAINLGKSFLECYGPESEGDIAELNKRFREKALRSRLHGMATTIAKYGVTRDELIGLTLDDVKLEGDTALVKSGGQIREVVDPTDAWRIARYLSFLEKLGIRHGPLVVWDLEGTSPDWGELDSFLIRSRSVRLSLSFNAELCRALLKSRIDREQSPVLESGIRKPD